jgi:hypothetical protein
MLPEASLDRSIAGWLVAELLPDSPGFAPFRGNTMAYAPTDRRTSMAERRAARQVRAREKARARTAERRQREQQLEDLATAWFEAEDEIADKESAAEEKIRKYTEKVRGEVQKETGKLREQMTDVVAKMLALTGVRSVAERLGIAEAVVREIKASLGDVASAPADSGSPSPTAPATAPSPSSSVPQPSPVLTVETATAVEGAATLPR